MDFLKQLRATNDDRYADWTGTAEVDVLFAGVALGEEAEEVLGAIKKLERAKRGWKGSRLSVRDLADEIGDVIIVLDRIASAHGIDLEDAVSTKFNKTSEKHGFPHRL